MNQSPWDDDDPFGFDAPASSTDAHRHEHDAAFDDEDPFGRSGDGGPFTSPVSVEPGVRRTHRRRWAIGAAVAALTVAGIGAGAEWTRADDARVPPSSASSPAASPSSRSAEPSTPTAVTASPSATTPSVSPSSPSTTVSGATLASIEVKGRAPSAGYDRALFGQEWADVDRNGCDTRNDILRRDLDAVRIRPGTSGCVVEAGVLDDPYGAGRIRFERGYETSNEVHVDHLVSLSNAWQTGAQSWSPDRREAFANDPLNLLAVDGPLNMQKSDGDAATWLPPARSFWCDFVTRQVAVKAKYGLWVTPAERQAIERALERC